MGREGERKREIHQLVASHMPSTGDLARNPGMCPDWESNLGPACRPVLDALSHTSQGSNFFSYREIKGDESNQSRRWVGMGEMM